MGFTKYLKGTTVLLTVTALAFALNGCGGGKKDAKKFSVPPDQLPEGVISVIKPKPNNETIFVRALVQESIRRNQIAKLYNEALIHYDPKKGSAAEHEKLLKRAKKAWKDARDSASVAMFYAMGLSQLERTEGYDPYQKSKALLIVPEIHLMPVAYAKENKKLNTKEEVYSKIHGSYKVGIKKEIDKFPEGKQLLAISKMYHTDGKTACDIMKDVNPDYFNRGRSWEDISYDVAYRSANVAKTAGKVAGIGLAAVGTAAAAGPVAMIAGGIAVTVKVVDTGLDAVQTSLVVLTGEEDKGLNKALAYTGAADTAASIMTFDLTKPIATLKGVSSYKFKEGATLLDQLKGYAYMTGKGLGSVTRELAKGNLKDAVKLINLEGVNNSMGVVSGIYSTGSEIKGALQSNDEGKNGVLAISSNETEDGRIEVRTGLISQKDRKKMTDKEKEAEKEKLKALGMTAKEIEEAETNVKQTKAAGSVKTQKELEKEAQSLLEAGGGSDYKNMFDMLIDSTRQGLINAILGPGGKMSDLDKMLSEAAGEEMKATGVIVVKDDKGNIKSVQVVGEKKDAAAPFAPSKVAGTYHLKVDGEPVTVVVTANGGTISASYYYFMEHYDEKGELTSKEKKTVGPFTPSYDPQTGYGSAGKYNFHFTNNGGSIGLSVH